MEVSPRHLHTVTGWPFRDGTGDPPSNYPNSVSLTPIPVGIPFSIAHSTVRVESNVNGHLQVDWHSVDCFAIKREYLAAFPHDGST